jgi:hypothetical protein
MQGLHQCSSKSEHYDSLFADAAIKSRTELIAPRPPRSRRDTEKNRKGKIRTEERRRSQQSHAFVIPNAAFFVAAEESQSAQAARVSLKRPRAATKDENHPIRIASINFDQ